jgi:hypothetical protein
LNIFEALHAKFTAISKNIACAGPFSSEEHQYWNFIVIKNHE